MTWHPTDEDLILRFYGELDEPAARRVEAHVAACAVCRAEWAALADTLRAVDRADVPAPPDGFEAVMWARVSQALPQRARWSWRQLVPAAALAAAILVLVTTARRPELGVAPGQAGEALAGAAAEDARGKTERRVLFTALDDHLAQAEVLLIELMNAPANGELEFHLERETADDLVASGRLYRSTASETGDGEFVLVLEDIERVLVEVARSPQRIPRRELEALRGRIDEDDLLFKVRAAASEVRARQQNLITVSEGSL
jgi:hypothetical protein